MNIGIRYRDRATVRTAEYNREHGKRWDDAGTQQERSVIQAESGVCGESKLFELYDLYGFDPVLDMTIDRMHMCSNLLKRDFLEKIWPDLLDNAQLPPNLRNPEQGGLIFRDEFERALKKVKWTREQIASGVASVRCLTDKLGGWKTDEYLK